MKMQLLDRFPALRKTSTRALIRDGEASGVRLTKYYSPKAPEESDNQKQPRKNPDYSMRALFQTNKKVNFGNKDLELEEEN